MATVIVVGGGPAGLGLAYVLATRGIDVTVLERQSDFEREFRGEILMPSGVEALREIGLGAPLVDVPSEVQSGIAVYLNGGLVFEEQFSGGLFARTLPEAICQPKLLEMMVSEASASSHFRLERGASVKDLIFDGGRVVGVRVRTGDGEKEMYADLVVGADGRASIVRKRGGFRVNEVSPPLDVVWCKLPCPEGWGAPRAYTGSGHFLVAYRSWDQALQLAWVIRKGTFGELKSRGAEEWLEKMEDHVSPDLAEHIRKYGPDIHKPFLLDSKSECLENWSVPGALTIGDAAHTMSPVGGQGINIALRDTVVAANHLVPALSASNLDGLPAALEAIQRERMPEVRFIQRFQGMAPRVGFSSAWWGEPLRKVALGLLSRRAFRMRAAGHAAPIPFGVTEVKLRV